MQLNSGETRKNNYFENPKKPNIQTPKCLCNYIYELVNESISYHIKNESDIILDIGCNFGNLSEPFISITDNCIGIDIDDYYEKYHSQFYQLNFLEQQLPINKNNVKLILCNPPWNNPNRLYKKAYLPEIFLRRIFEVFSENIPIIFLTSYTLLMNNNILSKKRNKFTGKLKCSYSKRYSFLSNYCDKVTGILELPINIFENVKIYNHVLFFNILMKNFLNYLNEDFLENYNE